jgi:SPOR domain
MADYPTRRTNRFNDCYEPPDVVARPRDHASDPLTELARLIGRSEQYSGAERSAPRSPARPGYRDPEPVYREPEPREWHIEDPAPAHASEPAREYQPYNREVPFAREERFDTWRTDDGVHDAARVASGGYEATSDHYDQDTEREHHARDDHELAQYADESEYGEGAEDQFYDDPPRAHRHGALVTALALIGCAMLGTAGAYAYRSYHAQPVGMQPPPVIAAAETPNKIVPQSAGEAQSGKAVQDRLANAGKEQIVSKQEEPVALKDIGTPTAPRVVLPAPVTAAPSAGSPQAAGASGGPSNEPKKIRTVTIRAEGDTSGRPAGAPTQLGPNARAAVPAPSRAAPQSSPLSLDPQGKDQAKDQAGDQASEAPARIRSATAPAAGASRASSSTASSGGVMVQLSSHKSESEALASYRSLQSKFPDELGSRQGVVRRADLGAKGVFYRAMVGPFASAQEANQFCAGLKAAGGSCVVPGH